MILRITDGTTTVNLTGGTNSFYLSESYAPVAPEPSVIEAVAQAVRDGGEVTAVTLRNVVETVTLAVVASAFSTVQAAQRGLEMLLQQAGNRQKTGKGAQVWLEYRAADSGDVYRSELLYGRLEPDPETGSAAWIAASALRYVVMWQRRFFWEGARTELALDNTSTGSKATGGVTVYNHHDSTSGHDNYVDIAAGDVGGVLPAPLELSFYNSYSCHVHPHSGSRGSQLRCRQRGSHSQRGFERRILSNRHVGRRYRNTGLALGFKRGVPGDGQGQPFPSTGAGGECLHRPARVYQNVAFGDDDCRNAGSGRRDWPGRFRHRATAALSRRGDRPVPLDAQHVRTAHGGRDARARLSAIHAVG
jgi:hypothetical protein